MKFTNYISNITHKYSNHKYCIYLKPTYLNKNMTKPNIVDKNIIFSFFCKNAIIRIEEKRGE